MRRRLNIPEPVWNAIEAHLHERIAEVQARFLSAAEDEDTFTGHLGALLGASERKVMVDGRAWYWSVEYTKFRGRGKDATETHLGADGIFEIRVHGTEVEGRKSVLFQSKFGEPNDNEAREQALRMSNWREASVFLSYEPQQILVYPIDEVLRPANRRGVDFEDFFMRRFVGCTTGDSDLYYDAKARTLHWRDDQGIQVAVKFPIPRRLRVNILSPFQRPPSSTIIMPGEITEHRMDSTASDRLGLLSGFSTSDLTRAKRETALLYHPDRMPNLNDELKKISNRRMTEFNVAYAELKKRRSRS